MTIVFGDTSVHSGGMELEYGFYDTVCPQCAQKTETHVYETMIDGRISKHARTACGKCGYYDAASDLPYRTGSYVPLDVDTLDATSDWAGPAQESMDGPPDSSTRFLGAALWWCIYHWRLLRCFASGDIGWLGLRQGLLNHPPAVAGPRGNFVIDPDSDPA